MILMDRLNSSTSWSEKELASDPHGVPEKAQKVQGMFHSIASSYDMNNRLHSLGLDQYWRREAVKAASRVSEDSILDVACGTGDLTCLLAQDHSGPVKGVDFTPRMLELACQKRDRLGLSEIEYEEANAINLNELDSTWEILTIAFGLRNIQDWQAALREFRRVLKPNGRLVILEFTEPPNKVIRTFHRFYTHYVMPFSATLLSRDRSGAYKYLPKSVETFPDHELLASEVESAGFNNVETKLLTFGTVAITKAICS